jgi:hypothetical protein
MIIEAICQIMMRPNQNRFTNYLAMFICGLLPWVARATTEFDLRSEGRSFEFIKPYDQSNLGICYAVTASEIYDAILTRKNKDVYMRRQIATHFSEPIVTALLFSAAARILTKSTPAATSNLKQNVNNSSGGLFINRITELVALDEKSLGPNMTAALSAFSWSNPRDSLPPIPQVLSVPSYGANYQIVNGGICAAYNVLRAWGPCSTHDPLVSKFKTIKSNPDQIFYKDDTQWYEVSQKCIKVDQIDVYLASECKDMQLSSFIAKPVISGKPVGEIVKKFRNYMQEASTRISVEVQNNKPVGISLCAKALLKDKDARAIGACGEHGVIVIGQRFVNGRKQFLIRNSWGENACAGYREEIERQCSANGDFWIDEESLLSSSFGISYIDTGLADAKEKSKEF